MPENDKPAPLRFYTTTEIADLLQMNVQVIARKLKAAEIAGYKIGKDWRIKESDLQEWLDRHLNRNNLHPSQQVVRRFMKGGRFPALPSHRKKRNYILEYILRQFELNRVYTEKEVNEKIMRYFDDYCFVRREFICEKMMYRQAGKYRRNAAYRFSEESPAPPPRRPST